MTLKHLVSLGNVRDERVRGYRPLTLTNQLRLRRKGAGFLSHLIVYVDYGTFFRHSGAHTSTFHKAFVEVVSISLGGVMSLVIV